MRELILEKCTLPTCIEHKRLVRADEFSVNVNHFNQSLFKSFICKISRVSHDNSGVYFYQVIEMLPDPKENFSKKNLLQK